MRKTTLLINLLLRHGWLDYNNKNIFGKSLFQPEYHILIKAFEEKLPKEVIIRLFENQCELTDLGISPISVVEKMGKDIREKSVVECKFYQSKTSIEKTGNKETEACILFNQNTSTTPF